MAAARVKRPFALRTNVSSEKDVAELATRFASGLKIAEASSKSRKGALSNTKGIRPPAKTSEESKSSAMRSVNSVLQSLTSAIQSGWKATTAPSGSSYTIAGITLLATTARSSLAMLRRLSGGALDIERAALSVVGKLVMLEMFENALDILTDMQPHISSLYENSRLPLASQKLSFLLLPLPTSFPIEPGIQSIISTYLIHAYTVATAIVSSKTAMVQAFSKTLEEPGSFASWVSFLTDIPEKTIGSLIKRYYVLLTSTLTALPVVPSELLRIRFHALRALLLTSEVLTSSFWEQCLKFASSYAKSSEPPAPEIEKSKTIVSCFHSVLEAAGARHDGSSMMSGKGWIMFCEYWLSLAKRAGDLDSLNRAATCIRHAASTSDVSTLEMKSEQASSDCSSETKLLVSSRASACFAQTSTLLESKDITEDNSDLIASISSSLSCLKELCSMLALHKSTSLESKVRRGLEKLRRACIKVLGAESCTSQLQICTIVEGIVNVLENIIEYGECQATELGDYAVSALDALFTLATSILEPQRLDTCDRAFDYLAQGSRIIDLFERRTAASRPESRRSQANYTRCLSGAFFNIAATLYKAEKYGIAVRFLLQACPMAVKATELHDRGSSVGGVRKEKDKTDNDDNDADLWKAHKEQLHRRWELLAICYSKMGDKKLAHDAFVRGVARYPFKKAVTEGSKGCTDEDELNSETQKQLCAMIDRLTYIGAAEIFLEDKVSLLQSLREASVPDLAIGAVIMRQIRSLDESRWKPPIQKVVGHLLEDLLSVYSKEYPVRRSKSLIWQLEHFYYEESAASLLRVNENVEEVKSLLRDKIDIHNDAQLASLRPYYIALVKVWAVLHAHRSGQSVQKIKQQTGEFIDTLRLLVDDGKQASRSPQTSYKLKKNASKGGRAPVVVRKAVAPRTARKIPINPKPRKSLEASPTQHTNSSSTASGSSECRALVSLLVMLSELLGVLGLTLLRMEVLSFGKRLIEKVDGDTSDSYAYLCSALAHDLLCIGKYAQSKALMSDVSIHVRESHLPDSSKILLYLRQAQVLAFTDSHQESLAHYEEARRIFRNLSLDENGLSTYSKIRDRVASLESAALAAGVLATIRDMKGNLVDCLKATLQRLRILNKATELLSRLSPSKKLERSSEDGDPFAMPDLKEALPVIGNNHQDFDTAPEHKALQREARSVSDGQEWRIATMLLETMHALYRLYFIRGSVREAEYFADQAEALSGALQSPVQTVQALLRKSEIYLYLGQVENCEEKLNKATSYLTDPEALAVVDARWMRGNQLQRQAKALEAANEYNKAWEVIIDLETTFKIFDSLTTNRRHSHQSRKTEAEGMPHTFVPSHQAAILREKVWLKRDDLDDEYAELLQHLMSLPQLPDILASVNHLLSRLSLHDIHDRFRSDMSLSSLAESIIALPMGMARENTVLFSPSQEVQEALDQADDLLSEGLKKHAERNNVVQLRNMAVNGALLNIYQASLGKSSSHGPTLAAHLVDMAASITIHRELSEAIAFKFPDLDRRDDTEWPSESSEVESSKASRRSKPSARSLFAQISDDSDEDDSSLEDCTMRKYWEYIYRKLKTTPYVSTMDSRSEIDILPKNWMVINISLTEDKSALLISRQLPHREPIVFCIPLRGRREEDEHHFTYDDAMAIFRDIIKASDEGTRKVHDIQADDKNGKAAWWTERKQLNQRLKELLDNIEFCWLGAFKTILGQPMRMPPDALSSLQARFEKVFKNILGSQEKKNQKARLKLDAGLLELFATLPPNCRDEELEDIIYFILDLYHFHGLPVALSEVDVDVVAVDLRTALEEHHARMRGRITPEPDTHTFLVLDKNLQPLPWESIPILRSKCVCRVPSLSFITDRLVLARSQRGLSLESEGGQTAKVDRVNVDPSKGYFVLNPGGDLVRTEERFTGWVDNMKRVGWDGVVGTPPSEQQFLNALQRKDLVVYFGHAGAEQYVRSHKIRHLSRCAATMLWGCSSGELRDMGDFDRVGTPNNYMIAGCPTFVANLWDVTDRDIDKFAFAVFDKMKIHPKEVGKWQKGERAAGDGKVSIAAAVAESRDSCKLNYLNGAAVVVYGIPFYL